MMNRSLRLVIIGDLISKGRACSFERIVSQLGCSEVTARRDITSIKGLRSYTHNGRFITLPEIPMFDEYGVWFHKKIGFTNFKNSLELIVNVINRCEGGITKESLDEILKIDVYKQIHTLLLREQINRVKIGRKYHYISDDLAKNKQKRARLLRADVIEEHHDAKVSITDLIALLKVVLMEHKVVIDSKSIKRMAQKYSLRIPLKKIERLLLKYKLSEKKML
jgi:hypothetical protein